MAQQEGPFSQYLDQSAVAAFKPSPVPQPTGLEGTGAAIGNIAMNFINGLRQGRMQKYAMQEAEREKQFNAYQQAIKTVAASDLPDQEKHRLHTQLSIPLIQSIAGDKEATSKNTGNPLTDVIKHIATSVVGGNLPKKGAPLSMEPVVAALQAASNPSLSKTKLISDLERQGRVAYENFVKEKRAKGEPVTDQDIDINPELRDISLKIKELGGQSFLPALQRGAPSSSTPWQLHQVEQKQKDIENKQEASNLFFSSELPDNKLTQDALSQIGQAANILKRAAPKLTPQYVSDSYGNVRQALYYDHPTLGGYYDSSTREKIDNANKATAVQINRGSKESMSKSILTASNDVKQIFSDNPESASMFVNMLANVRRPEDINNIVMKAAASKVVKDKEQYVRQKDQHQFGVQLIKTANALPAKKQLTAITPLYEAAMSNFGSEEAIASTAKLPALERSANQRVLIALIAKATDPDSVIRPSEIEYWGSATIGMSKLNYLLTRYAEGAKIELNADEERALAGIAKNIHQTISKAAAEQRKELFDAASYKEPSVRSETTPSLATPTPPSTGRARFNTKTPTFNPSAKPFQR